MSPNALLSAQRAVCARLGVPHVPCAGKVGIALNVSTGEQPVNGLRHPPTKDTSGWFLWAGQELGDDPDFFVPLHVEHLMQWCPVALPYLGMPPGWRFLIAPGYEDVWEDTSLLDQ